MVTRDASDATDAVANGFASTLAKSSDPELDAAGESLRVALLRSTRRSAIDVVGQRSPDSPPRSEALVLDAVEPRVAVIRRAFGELPERWRSVLWLVEVDGVAPTEAAQVIHVAPTAVTPLLERAHRGFQEQVLLIAIGASSPALCRRTSDRLTDYRAGSLAEADEAQVRSHLDGCGSCRARLASLDDVIPVLRSAGQPLPVAVADLAAARWSAALVVDSGPLHLVLPGGQPMPVWAQRAFAGVVAGVVALGITGATMIAGRGRGGEREVVARPQLAGGESAAGIPDLSDLDLDGSGLNLPTTPPESARSSSPSARTGAPLPRTGAAPAAAIVDTPVAAAGPAPTQGGSSGGSSVQPSPAPDAGPPSDAPSSDSVTVAVAGLGWVTVGPDCQGGGLLGQSAGSCEAPATDGPVTVSLPLSSP